jgi:hypothetical protein
VAGTAAVAALPERTRLLFDALFEEARELDEGVRCFV